MILTAKYALKGFWLALIALVVVAALAFGFYHKVRTDGFKILFWSHEGYAEKVERLEGEIQSILAAQKAAEGAQQEVNDAAAESYRRIAERIDKYADQEHAAHLDAADRYISAHRVRCPTVGSTSGETSASPASDGSRDTQGAGGAPVVDADAAMADMVAVHANDVRICTTNTIKAEAARVFALELEKATKQD